MNKFLPIGERLKAERERLNYSQARFAEVAGVTRKTLFGYETGLRAPDGGALSNWAAVGLDVLYVITGQHGGAPPPDHREEKLLDNYRNAGEDGKRVIEGAAHLAAQSAQVGRAKSSRKHAA